MPVCNRSGDRSTGSPGNKPREGAAELPSCQQPRAAVDGGDAVPSAARGAVIIYPGDEPLSCRFVPASVRAPLPVRPAEPKPGPIAHCREQPINARWVQTLEDANGAGRW